MLVQLTNPTLAQFIESQVRDGVYPTVDDAIAAAVEQMMTAAAADLDDDAVDAIQRAEGQLERGEGIDFTTFASDFRKRHNIG